MNPRFVVDPVQVSKFHGRPYNKVSFSSDEERRGFLEERWRELLLIDKEIARFGFVSNFGRPANTDYDYYISEDIGVGWILCFTMMKRAMVRREILEGLAQFLASLKQTKAIGVSCEFVDTLEPELFFIVITQEVIFGQLESRETARAFGFDPDSKQIGPIQ